MNDNHHNMLDVWLSGGVIVQATSAISDPDTHPHPDKRGLSIITSGSIDTNLYPWAKTFEKIDVTLYFSDEIPLDGGVASLSASKSDHESNFANQDSLDIEAFLPTASFTLVSQILTSNRTGRPRLILLTGDDIAAWGAQDDSELLKAQECAFDYETLAADGEEARNKIDEQTGDNTTPLRRRRSQYQNVGGAVNPVRGVIIGGLILVFLVVLVALNA